MATRASYAVLSKEELRKRYDYVASFSEGLARVRKDDQEFHIRTDGQPAYEERYDDVYSFSEGLARVRKDKQWFHIRPDGTRVGGDDDNE